MSEVREGSDPTTNGQPELGGRIKPAIILAHASYLTPEHYQAPIEQLESLGYEVIAPDLRNGDPHMSVQEGREIMAAVSSGKWIVARVAHSAGGRIIDAAKNYNPPVESPGDPVSIYCAASLPPVQEKPLLNAIIQSGHFRNTRRFLRGIDRTGSMWKLREDVAEDLIFADLPPRRRREYAKMITLQHRNFDMEPIQPPAGPIFAVVPNDDGVVKPRWQQAMAPRLVKAEVLQVKSNHGYPFYGEQFAELVDTLIRQEVNLDLLPLQRRGN